MKITKQLLTVIKEASRYVSKDQLRPQMTGVHFECEKGKLSIVATDAHRLFWWEGKHEGEFYFTMPIEAIKETK